MNEKIAVYKDGQQYGPFTVEEVYEHVLKGVFNPTTDFAWHEGMSDWLPLKEVILQVAPPPSQPPIPQADVTPVPTVTSTIDPTPPPKDEPAPARFWITFVLCLVLGIFGAHRFWLGKKSAFIMLLTFGGCGLWWLIDIVLLLSNQLKDRKDQRVINPMPVATWPIAAVWLLIVFANGHGKGGNNVTTPNTASQTPPAPAPVDSSVKKLSYSGSYELAEPKAGVDRVLFMLDDKSFTAITTIGDTTIIGKGGDVHDGSIQTELTKQEVSDNEAHLEGTVIVATKVNDTPLIKTLHFTLDWHKGADGMQDTIDYTTVGNEDGNAITDTFHFKRQASSNNASTTPPKTIPSYAGKYQSFLPVNVMGDDDLDNSLLVITDSQNLHLIINSRMYGEVTYEGTYTVASDDDKSITLKGTLRHKDGSFDFTIQGDKSSLDTLNFYGGAVQPAELNTTIGSAKYHVVKEQPDSQSGN